MVGNPGAAASTGPSSTRLQPLPPGTAGSCLPALEKSPCKVLAGRVLAAGSGEGPALPLPGFRRCQQPLVFLACRLAPLLSAPSPSGHLPVSSHHPPCLLYPLPFHKNPSHCIRPTPFQDDSALITSARTLVPNKVAFTDRGLQLQHRFWGDTIQSTTDTEHNFVFSKAVYPVGPSRRTGTENPAQGTGASNGNSPRG